MDITVEIIASLLAESDAAPAASELHGCIAGLCCAHSTAAHGPALRQIFESYGVTATEPLREVLTSCRQTVQAELNDGFALQLLLPDSEAPILERVDGLANWTRGFLAGYAIALAEEGRGEVVLSDDCRETLEDLAAICQVGVDEEDEPEDAERNLFELGEYVRLASVRLYLERGEEPLPEDAPAIANPAALFGRTVH